MACYGLNLIAIRAATRDAWPRVGSDFETRMAGTAEPGGTVVRFPRADVPTANNESNTGIGADSGTGPDSPGGAWGRMRAGLKAEDPAVFASWFDALTSAGRAGECLVLVAPSGFHATYVRTHYAERLRRALALANGPRDLRIIAAIDGAR